MEKRSGNELDQLHMSFCFDINGSPLMATVSTIRDVLKTSEKITKRKE